MSAEIEAMGDIATGALAASAFDADGGTDGTGSRHAATARCLNCGNFLSNRYCDYCGQSSHVHRTVMAFLHDILHGILHFEGKMWRTLPLLVTRPGDLTRRYINGERVRFFSPLALFLFAIFLTFGVFQTLGPGLDKASSNTEMTLDDQAEKNQARSAIYKEIADAEKKLAAAQAQNRAGGDVPTAELEDNVKALHRARDMVEERGSFNFTDTRSDIPAINAVLQRMNDNPSLLINKFQGNAYKYAWALIPLSAPFLWLLYPFSRRFGIYDHLIFTAYSLSFMLLLSSALCIGAWLGLDEGVIAITAIFVPPAHIYRQLRGTYGSSRWGSAIRTILLTSFAALLLALFLIGLLALGAMG